MSDLIERINRATKSARQHFSEKIDSAIVLGSGLSGIELDGYQEIVRLDYSSIEGLPMSTAPSHAGELRISSNTKHSVAVCAGRQHLYEGYSAQEVAMLTYLLKQLGCERFIITNAAGALNENYAPGDIMLIQDHINGTGHNPLVGNFTGQLAHNESLFENRFPDMSNAYDKRLRAQAQSLANSLDIDCHQGIYAGVLGPSLETSAERRMFRQLGGDVIGMSTVIETIAANHCQMKVLGISAITNKATGHVSQQPDTIEDVLRYAAVAGEKIKHLVENLLLQTNA